VRDSEGAERCIVSAVRTGAAPAQMADLLFSAATDHRYLDSGHVLDFTNKALEALDIAGWSHAEVVLSSLAELSTLLDERQKVDAAGALVANYLCSGGDADQLLAVMGGLLLREDRNFHTIQAIEAAFRQYARLRDTTVGVHVLVAAARYLAAHSPTMRSQGQTYDIARRLSRGEILYEE
jgi:hypothetical protein